ncbi:helix-turn-helix domain-containing protein [Acetonema longum]|uniref:DNA-binding protein n=1 Tax=Acetonema longum DSM 6540 TaxID=1009370 RepID=F7NKP5_9FIRM|nr:XRE family transcriptional regulator [Acetonema longum]EGO63349.1 DNA-binding protein [Acetonema longum DSM 6540]
MHNTDDSVELGQRIAAARAAKNLSLRQLAEKLNVTPSLLSQIERGLANPSLNTLRMIAVSLDVPLFSLFIEPAAVNNLITRADNRKKIIFPHSNWEYTLLSPDLNGAIEMVLMTVPPHSQTAQIPLSHIGEEIAYVMSGTLTLYLGDSVEELGEGDSVKIPPSLPHMWENRDETEATVIFAVTPPSF